MFFESENIKLKNFFAVCDIIAEERVCTRKLIAERSKISYPTVSKTAEQLLDMGIISERQSTKGYTYSFSGKYCLAIADLRGDSVMHFTDLGGRELHCVTHRESDAFFYDEKLSLFFRDSSIICKRRFPKCRLSGVCVILPSASESFRDTRSILSSKERLTALVSSYFDTADVRIVTAADAASEAMSGERALVVMKEPSGVVCKAVGYGTSGVGILKSVTTTDIAGAASSEELALKIACALGNLCDVLAPDLIYVDGGGMFSASAFPRKLKLALARFNCKDEDSLPRILHSKGQLAVSSASRILRNGYVEKRINESKNSTISDKERQRQ